MEDSMKISCALVLALSLPVSAQAFDPWSEADKNRQGAFNVALALDWRQTLQLIKEPDKYYETNPILGKYPSDSKVNTYFALSMLGHAAVTHVLPSKWRPYWQYTWIAIETGVVAHNYKAGIRLNF
jgi:hypothetical protein